MEESAQIQGSPTGPRRSTEPASQTESPSTAATPPPLPGARIMMPPSRRPDHRAPARSRPHRRAGGWDDPRILLAMLATVLALPALLLISRPNSTKAEALSTEADTSLVARSRSLVASTTEAPVTAASATTSGPATTAAPPATEAAPPTTAWTPPTTAWTPPTTAWTPPTTAWTPPATTPPTTAWVPPPTPAAPVASGNSESGEASWYDWRPGECAHKTIPKGTLVTIHASNGNTATCVVTDRGPYGPGRIIDLDRGVFAQLTSPGSGVIGVTITW